MILVCEHNNIRLSLLLAIRFCLYFGIELQKCYSFWVFIIVCLFGKIEGLLGLIHVLKDIFSVFALLKLSEDSLGHGVSNEFLSSGTLLRGSHQKLAIFWFVLVG